MRNLIAEMQGSICDASEIGQQLVALSESLSTAKGKKQYQYLKKDVKRQVDAIADVLAALPKVVECYEARNRCKDAFGRAWRDGLCAPPWDEEAERWFRVAAERGNDAA